MRATRMFTALAAVAVIGVACGDDVAGIPAGLEVYTATLNAANEPTPVTSTATGTAIVTVLGNQVTWKVDIISPIDSITLGHIHRRHPDSTAGNVQVNFAPAPTGLDFTGTATVGSAASVNDSILVLMRAGRGYVNIHTRVYPGGEIRGTLIKQ
jgi:hypothetical protein